ncbi:MAG TPA: IS21 family transposase [Terriglobales bacterium]|nr:IS21 family transposase [Terriglobales bacterium]
MLRGKDVQELEELKREGLSIRAISRLTGYDRKTVRKYLQQPEARPVYGPRPAPPSKLDSFKEYLGERLKAGVWNAQVLLRELRARGYPGGYTILKDWLLPQRQAATTVAVRRFETPPGKQAQVDWGHLGSLEMDGQERKLNAFTFTLGYSRTMMAEAALDQKLGTLLKMHEEAFRQLGGVPEEILYDRMKTVWLETDERGEVVWHPVFLDFARYWGFRPRLCRPYRAQTKGKVESGVKYLRRNFLCGLQGREPSGLQDLNAQLRAWVWEVANQRVHGTTHEQVAVRWDVDQFSLQPLDGRPPYPYLDDELRKVARDAYVSWQGSRYSVPWSYAGKQVWVRERGSDVEVLYGQERIAVHGQARHRHAVVTQAEHHRGIPLGARHERKTLIHIQDTAPVVEIRPLAAYESAAAGGGR